jgi:hypothetical protein
MYTVIVTASPNNGINVQDPYPTEDKVIIEAKPGETVTAYLQDSQFDRIRSQLDAMVALSLLSYSALNGPASELANDSTVPGISVADALDNLKAGVVGNDVMVCSGGDESNNVTDAYLRGPGGTPMNLAGYVMPFDAKITSLSLASRGTESWTLEVRKNNAAAVIASLAVSGKEREYGNVDVDVDAGDELQLFCNGTSINAPSGSIFLTRR